MWNAVLNKLECVSMRNQEWLTLQKRLKMQWKRREATWRDGRRWVENKHALHRHTHKLCTINVSVLINSSLEHWWTLDREKMTQSNTTTTTHKDIHCIALQCSTNTINTNIHTDYSLGEIWAAYFHSSNWNKNTKRRKKCILMKGNSTAMH